MAGKPLKSKIADAWEKVKELAGKLKDKVKKEKEPTLIKSGFWAVDPIEEEEGEWSVQAATEVV